MVGTIAGITLTQLPAEDPKSTKETKPTQPLFKDEVVARGKGFEVKKSEVEEAYILYKGHMASRGQRVPDDQGPAIEEKLMERLAMTKILMGKATDKDKKDAETVTEKYLGEMKQKFPSEDLFAQQLRATGMSLDEFKTRMLEQNICESVIDRELKSKVSISNDDVKKFYEENPAQFEQPEMVKAAHVLLSTLDKETQAPLPAPKKKEKEEQIRKLKERAEKGEDFSALAKQYSEDPGSKENGGEYTFPRGEMVKEFEAAAFSLKTNQVSDVVETKFGYHIIKLLEKMPAQKVELEKVSENLKAGLINREVQKQLPDYFEKLKKDFNVEFLAGQKKNEETKDKPKA